MVHILFQNLIYNIFIMEKQKKILKFLNECGINCDNLDELNGSLI